MPIYEFYCPDCHTVFSFLSKTVNTTKRPSCPSCKRPGLDRQVSGFAVTGKAREDKSQGTPDDLPIDEKRMERAISQLASEAERLSPDNPRDEAKLMRKFSEMTGLQFGDKMNDAINRLEDGADMAEVEKEMGDALDGEEMPFLMPGQKAAPSGRRPPPRRDTKLYEL